MLDTRKKQVQRPNRTILGRTLVLLTVCGLAAFLVLAIKLYEVQIIKHEFYENRAVEQQTRQATITASRGTIYDTNGKKLAMSASVETVFISPLEMLANDEDPMLIATGLSEILDVDRDSILKKMEDTKAQYKTIKQKIEYEDAVIVREFIKENKLKCVHLEPDSKRYYPNSSLACQVIGFVGTENTGLYGLEAQYDKYLVGTNGRVVRLKTEKGADMLFTDFENYYDAQDGNDIILSIDSIIQRYVEKQLAQAIADYDVQKGGACIAMRPETGEILAMASLGNYDLNNWAQISEAELERLSLITDEEEYAKALREAQFNQWRNKTLSDTYEPGSVFKTITLAIALEEGLISESDTFTCNGTLDIPGRGAGNPLHCWRHGGHGTQSLSKAVQNSCNVAFATIGLRIGAETFYKYVEAFGLFDKTGFDLPGEESGSIWWPKKDFLAEAADNRFSSLTAAAFGQTFNITPIQMITAFNATINGGYLTKPYVVKQITDSEGNIVEVKQPEVVRQVISEETSAAVRAILESVVSDGTGGNARVAGYRIGGKTGTSEKVAQDAARDDNAPKEYIVSFCGFAPADDPEIVILMLLDSPSAATGIYISGGMMAAPVVGNMMSDVLPYLGIAPQYTEEEKKDLDVIVPRLISKSVADAEKAVGIVGLEYKVVGDGDTVTGQLPAPNAVVAPGTKVIIYAGAEPSNGEVTVPNLRGKSYGAARTALESLGLFIKTTGLPKSDGLAAVSVQSIPADTIVTFGTVVEVTLTDKDSIELH